MVPTTTILAVRAPQAAGKLPSSDRPGAAMGAPPEVLGEANDGEVGLIGGFG